MGSYMGIYRRGISSDYHLTALFSSVIARPWKIKYRVENLRNWKKGTKKGLPIPKFLFNYKNQKVNRSSIDDRISMIGIRLYGHTVNPHIRTHVETFLGSYVGSQIVTYIGTYLNIHRNLKQEFLYEIRSEPTCITI